MKSYTDINQSRKLAKILRLESADFHFSANQSPQGYLEKPIWGNSEYANYDAFPCWSLAALLDYLCSIDMFPTIEHDDDQFKLTLSFVEENEERSISDVITIIIKNKELVGACVEMISKLHDLKII